MFCFFHFFLFSFHVSNLILSRDPWTDLKASHKFADESFWSLILCKFCVNIQQSVLFMHQHDGKENVHLWKRSCSNLRWNTIACVALPLLSALQNISTLQKYIFFFFCLDFCLISSNWIFSNMWSIFPTEFAHWNWQISRQKIDTELLLSQWQDEPNTFGEMFGS